MNGPDDDGLRAAWSAQTIESPRLDPGALMASVGEFERTVAKRNLRELAAGVVVVLSFGGVALVAADPLGQLGAASIAAGALFVMWTLVRRGRTAAAPGHLAEACLAWRRAELARERDLLAGVWRWYLGPLVPGLGMFVLSGLLRADTALEWAIQAVVIGAGVLVFGGIGKLNADAARALDDELRALDGLHV